MSSYKFRGYAPSTRQAYSVLPEGDYDFVVLECGEPHPSKSGKPIEVLDVVLQITKHDVRVWDYPWSGEDKNGDDRDNIGDFLVAVNRACKIGDEPDWRRVVGAHGRCRLKIEEGTGEYADKNKVAYYHIPKQVGPTTEPRPKTFGRAQVQTHSQEELNQARREAEKNAGGLEDLRVDDIPF